MLNLVTYLWLMVVILICEADLSIEFDEYEKIESPENCLISKNDESVHYLRCPDFNMTMVTDYRIDNDGNECYEYKSSMECPPSSLPYNYLSRMNSSRNSLELQDCLPPESGSFGEGWPRLQHFRFNNVLDMPPLKREHFSGMDNLWNLHLITTADFEMPDDLFDDLGKLKNLVLIVKNANKNILRSLNELHSLHLNILSSENLSDFDTSGLKNSPNFKRLRLWWNKFTQLKKRFFEGCSGLEFLELQSNKIDTIDADVFEPLINLRFIEIHFANLTSLTSGLFSTNKKLEKMTIGHSHLKSLSRFFEGCSRIEVLKLSANIIYTIDDDVFDPLTNLKYIKIEFDAHKSLPSRLFSKNKKLVKVEIGHSDLESLSGGFLSNLSNLCEVRIINCKLTSIPNGLFHGSNNLEIIDFRSNKLLSIPKDLIRNHTKLKVIELSGNNFSSFPLTFFLLSPMSFLIVP